MWIFIVCFLCSDAYSCMMITPVRFDADVASTFITDHAIFYTFILPCNIMVDRCTFVYVKSSSIVIDALCAVIPNVFQYCNVIQTHISQGVPYQYLSVNDF